MKTPIQELQRILNDLSSRGGNDESVDGLIIKTCMNMVTKIIKEEGLLEKEKQVIEDAYSDGQNDCHENHNYWNKEYYNETYNNEN